MTAYLFPPSKKGDLFKYITPFLSILSLNICSTVMKLQN